MKRPPTQEARATALQHFSIALPDFPGVRAEGNAAARCDDPHGCRLPGSRALRSACAARDLAGRQARRIRPVGARDSFDRLLAELSTPVSAAHATMLQALMDKDARPCTGPHACPVMTDPLIVRPLCIHCAIKTRSAAYPRAHTKSSRFYTSCWYNLNASSSGTMA
jgi:hypothetical protein